MCVHKTHTHTHTRTKNTEYILYNTVDRVVLDLPIPSCHKSKQASSFSETNKKLPLSQQINDTPLILTHTYIHTLRKSAKHNTR